MTAKSRLNLDTISVPKKPVLEHYISKFDDNKSLAPKKCGKFIVITMNLRPNRII